MSRSLRSCRRSCLRFLRRHRFRRRSRLRSRRPCPCRRSRLRFCRRRFCRRSRLGSRRRRCCHLCLHRWWPAAPPAARSRSGARAGRARCLSTGGRYAGPGERGERRTRARDQIPTRAAECHREAGAAPPNAAVRKPPSASASAVAVGGRSPSRRQSHSVAASAASRLAMRQRARPTWPKASASPLLTPRAADARAFAKPPSPVADSSIGSASSSSASRRCAARAAE